MIVHFFHKSISMEIEYGQTMGKKTYLVSDWDMLWYIMISLLLTWEFETKS